MNLPRLLADHTARAALLGTALLAAPRSEAPAAVMPSLTTGGSGSMIERAWGFDPASPRYVIDLYAPNYFLLGRYTNDLNTAPFDPLLDSGVLKPGTELDSTEAAFQLSFKFRLWTTDDRRWGVWAGYTQQSQWQLYNDSGNASRPFRETNYMPELILSYKPGLQWGGLQWNLFNLAFNHQSNGRSDTLSRSWNRIIASFGVEHQDLGVVARLWWRIPESSDSDDNPTLSEYYGWGDLSAIYKWRGNSFAATLRGNPSTGKGAGQLTWTSAPLLGPLRGYVKLFSGYGESLIDYNWNQSTIGIGVTLNDWL
jgi:phospholipase A1/A2